MPDLHARILAEIERREGRPSVLTPLDAVTRYGVNQLASNNRAYLAALKSIAEMHTPDPAIPTWCAYCTTADGQWPCATLLEVAGAMGVVA